MSCWREPFGGGTQTDCGIASVEDCPHLRGTPNPRTAQSSGAVACPDAATRCPRPFPSSLRPLPPHLSVERALDALHGIGRDGIAAGAPPKERLHRGISAKCDWRCNPCLLHNPAERPWMSRRVMSTEESLPYAGSGLAGGRDVVWQLAHSAKSPPVIRATATIPRVLYEEGVVTYCRSYLLSSWSRREREPSLSHVGGA